MGNLPYITSTVTHVADARIILILLVVVVVVVLLLCHWLIQVSGVLASINLILECHRIIIASGSWRKIPQPPLTPLEFKCRLRPLWKNLSTQFREKLEYNYSVVWKNASRKGG